MKKYLALLSLIALYNCNSTKNYIPLPVAKEPIKKAVPEAPAKPKVETFKDVAQSYKNENAEVLTDLLNNPSPNAAKTSVIIENKSKCDIVVKIVGQNYEKKVPIFAGKHGAVMLNKNQKYTFSSTICNAIYESTKHITESLAIKLSN